MDTEINLDGYKMDKIYFNMLWINIFAIIVLLIFTVLFGGPFYLIWHEKINSNREINIAIQRRRILALQNISVVFVVAIIGGILHELIHGFFYAIFAKHKFKSIKFGIKLKYGVAYCVCTELMKIKHVIIVVIMPAIILGFIPSIFSLFIGSLFLLVFGILFIMAGSGDFLVLLCLLKENKEHYVLDTLGEINCITIYRKNKKIEVQGRFT
ncbi:hypothetical protein Holit_02844 [Hollandina sp. SP2]